MPMSLRNLRRTRRSALTLETCEARLLMATAPPLGSVASFAILAGTTVTNTGATSIVGDVGVSPGTAITGFPPGVVSGGALHANDAAASQAQADLATAYTFLAGEAVDTSLSGQDLGGLTLTPGVYNFATTAALSTTLTLDAQGDRDAVFVIQVGTSLTTATNASVALVNGAHASNVFWQVGSSATIGTGTDFQGNILAFTSIVMDTGASIAPGRALAINGAVTLDTNTSSAVFTTVLTVTANDQTKVYGAALPTLTASYSGFINGDTAASLASLPTLTTTATAASHVVGSPYAITASGAADPYYTFVYEDGSLDVTAAPLTISADDQSKVYGAALPTLTASYVGFVNGDTTEVLNTLPTLATTATATSHVAGSPYAITIGGATADDYIISHLDGSLVVTPAPLVITADDQTKVYGAALPGLTASYNGFVNGDTAASLATLPTLVTTATAASRVAGSPYAITASGAVNPDYAIGYIDGSLAVTPAPLTITADDKTKVFGAALPPLTASYNGFVNGDTSASLATLPTLSTTATAASPVAGSPYAITASGAVDPDYAITYAAGELVVTPTPSLTGKVYLDFNANGVLDAGEPGFGGRFVFLDLNGNGVIDPNEPSVITDADGNYNFVDNPSGTSSVLEDTNRDGFNRYVVGQSATTLGGMVNIGVVPFSPIAPVKVVPNPFTATPNADPNTAYVQSLYKAVLGRVGADIEVNLWLAKMASGLTRAGVADGFVNSLEHRQDQVFGYYRDFLKRTPDSASAVWVNQLLSGVSEENVVESFLTSPEYQAAHQDPALLIRDLYLDVLGRGGEPAGVAFWQAALASGMTRAELAVEFVQSDEANDQLVDGFYSAFLRRRREPGTTSDFWVNVLESTDGSATDVAVGILTSPEYNQDATTPQA